MINFRTILLLAIGVLVATSMTQRMYSQEKSTKSIRPENASIQLQYMDEVPTRLSGKEINELQRETIEVSGRDGEKNTYEVVNLVEVLELTNAPLGESLRGEGLLNLVWIEASDGYRVVFTLPEIDPEFTQNKAYLAFRKNGQPLESPEGPYRLIMPGEKRHARWIRNIQSIRIEPATAPKR